MYIRVKKKLDMNCNYQIISYRPKEVLIKKKHLGFFIFLFLKPNEKRVFICEKKQYLQQIVIYFLIVKLMTNTC